MHRVALLERRVADLAAHDQRAVHGVGVHARADARLAAGEDRVDSLWRRSAQAIRQDQFYGTQRAAIVGAQHTERRLRQGLAGRIGQDQAAASASERCQRIEIGRAPHGHRGDTRDRAGERVTHRRSHRRRTNRTDRRCAVTDVDDVRDVIAG